VTEPSYLLDSNVCIYILGDARSAPALRLGKCKPGEAAASAVTYAEVIRGIPLQDDAAAAALDAFFRIVPVLPFDGPAARCYASIPFKRGTFDRLIVAHALARDMILVTANLKDFSYVPELKLEDWTMPG
jgi:tRNA(fMet)-specific endonuclease VapC